MRFAPLFLLLCCCLALPGASTAARQFALQLPATRPVPGGAAVPGQSTAGSPRRVPARRATLPRPGGRASEPGLDWSQSRLAIELRRQLPAHTVTHTGDTVKVSVESATLFAPHKSQLPASALPDVYKLAGVLQRVPATRIVVADYTDYSRAEATDVALSDRRAYAFAYALRAAGLAPSRVQYQGYGRLPTADSAASLNHRVEVLVLPGPVSRPPARNCPQPPPGPRCFSRQAGALTSFLGGFTPVSLAGAAWGPLLCSPLPATELAAGAAGFASPPAASTAHPFHA